MKPRLRAGFSLVELLVVIAIISLLAAVLLPVFAAAREQGRRTRCQSNLRQIGMAIELYTADYDGFYPCTGNILLWQGRYWRWPLAPYVASGAKPQDDNPLLSDRKEENVFLCPSDAESAKFDGTSYAYSMSFYLSPSQVNSLHTFASTVTPPGPPCTPQHESAVSFPARKVLVTEWTSNHESPHVAWYNANTAWQGARNALFADGHTTYIKMQRVLTANDGLPDVNLTVDGIAGFDIE